MNNMELLEEKIASIIKNYKKNDIPIVLDVNHVHKWIKQFDDEEQYIVLQETANLLDNYYVKKRDIKNYFKALWDTKQIFGEYPKKESEYMQFLSIQRKGNSQRKLVELMQQVILDEYNVELNTENSSKIHKYIYLDDGFYTGATLRHDISNWIDNYNPNENAELDIIFIGMYNNSYKYSMEKLEEKCSNKRIRVKMFWAHEFNNTFNGHPIDILWPKEIIGNSLLDQYIQSMQQQSIDENKGMYTFRSFDDANPEMFTSMQNRDIFEKALLKAGAYIVSLPQNAKKNMRPMGYSLNISLGYGAFFATYLNISNNCPLAFWWGDPLQDNTQTLGKWYPLLPREVNVARGVEWLEW